MKQVFVYIKTVTNQIINIPTTEKTLLLAKTIVVFSFH